MWTLTATSSKLNVLYEQKPYYYCQVSTTYTLLPPCTCTILAVTPGHVSRDTHRWVSIVAGYDQQTPVWRRKISLPSISSSSTPRQDVAPHVVRPSRWDPPLVGGRCCCLESRIEKSNAGSLSRSLELQQLWLGEFLRV